MSQIIFSRSAKAKFQVPPVIKEAQDSQVAMPNPALPVTVDPMDNLANQGHQELRANLGRPATTLNTARALIAKRRRHKMFRLTLRLNLLSTATSCILYVEVDHFLASMLPIYQNLIPLS